MVKALVSAVLTPSSILRRSVQAKAEVWTILGANRMKSRVPIVEMRFVLNINTENQNEGTPLLLWGPNAFQCLMLLTRLMCEKPRPGKASSPLCSCVGDRKSCGQRNWELLTF